MKNDAILFLAHSRGMGVTYHFTNLVVALHQAAEHTDARLIAGGTPAEQNPGLWDRIRNAYPQDNILVFDDESQSIATAVNNLLDQHERVVVHIHGFHQFLTLWPLKRKQPTRLKLVITLNSFQHGNWKRVPLTCIYSLLYRRYVDFVNFMTPYTSEQFLCSKAMFNAGNRTEGQSHLYRALELLSSNIHAMTDLATAMLMLGNMEKAREYGERALHFDPSYILAQGLLKTIDRIEGK